MLKRDGQPSLFAEGLIHYQGAIKANIGTDLRFVYTMKNVDRIGWEPDIWCDPVSALDNAIKLAGRYFLADQNDLNELKEKISKAE